MFFLQKCFKSASKKAPLGGCWYTTLLNLLVAVAEVEVDVGVLVVGVAVVAALLGVVLVFK